VGRHFTSFASQAAGAANQLPWYMDSEYDVAYFKMQRCLDGATFAPLGQLPATASPRKRWPSGWRKRSTKYEGHATLTNNGALFMPQAHQALLGGHSVGHICCEYGVEHRLTKPARLGINGQVACMNRLIEPALL
jgi:hypothetical protein